MRIDTGTSAYPSTTFNPSTTSLCQSVQDLFHLWEFPFVNLFHLWEFPLKQERRRITTSLQVAVYQYIISIYNLFIYHLQIYFSIVKTVPFTRKPQWQNY